MPIEKPKTIFYKRSRFVTHLPADYLYSPSHSWIAQVESEVWRVGLTKFATRMLGDMVDYGFETQPGARVEAGQIVGWIEGFKAISDLFCIGTGEFLGSNPDLKQDIQVVDKECYVKGWLYAIKGTPDPRCMDAAAYMTLLDRTIDKILEREQKEIQ